VLFFLCAVFFIVLMVLFYLRTIFTINIIYGRRTHKQSSILYSLYVLCTVLS